MYTQYREFSSRHTVVSFGDGKVMASIYVLCGIYNSLLLGEKERQTVH